MYRRYKFPESPTLNGQRDSPWLRHWKPTSIVTFAPKTHRHAYGVIDSHHPVLSQKGRTILVIGRPSGISYTTAHTFALVRADRVIILGRRPEVVTKAAGSLHAVLPSDFPGELQGRVVDISSLDNIAASWDKFREENIYVGVVVLNAASFSKVAPILELGTEILLDGYQVNVLAGYRFAQRLSMQNLGLKKVFSLLLQPPWPLGILQVNHITNSTPSMCPP